jgi:hypothetical protein
MDVADSFICPGFVDIHTHGGAGYDYMDGTLEAVRLSNRAHARHGTTTLLPTTTSGTSAQLQSMLDTVQAIQQRWSLVDGARIGGVHWYGPCRIPTSTCQRWLEGSFGRRLVPQNSPVRRTFAAPHLLLDVW